MSNMSKKDWESDSFFEPLCPECGCLIEKINNPDRYMWWRNKNLLMCSQCHCEYTWSDIEYIYKVACVYIKKVKETVSE